MNAKVITLVSIVLVALLVAALAIPHGGGNQSADGPSTQPGQPTSLLVYCAAAMRKPVTAAAAQYQKKYGVQIQLQFGASQTLLTNVQLSKAGDLYLPADDSYIGIARRYGLIAETANLATMKPVLAVRAGNPKNIHALDDLSRPGVRVGLADPKAAAIGKVVKETLAPLGKWDAIERLAIVTKPTITDIATDLTIDTVDATFVWDSTVAQYKGALEAVPVPELAEKKSIIAAAVLKTTKQPTTALRFLRYLSAKDKGLTHFAADGFVPADGDAWDEHPRLTLYGGAMLRPAIDDTIKKFEQREGVQVDRVYNGCGILVGQMKIGQRPDAYFACDKSFMVQVKDLFLDPVDISTNQLVILVPKENPHNVQSLADLVKPGLRIGVGHEKQCALGALTETTLREGKLYEEVRKNVAVESPTGDLLVNQLLAKSLDAVVAYVSNATGHGDELKAIKIDIPCALAVQPMAVGRESKHRQLTSRLMETLQSAESRSQFEAWGFRWGNVSGQ